MLWDGITMDPNTTGQIKITAYIVGDFIEITNSKAYNLDGINDYIVIPNLSSRPELMDFSGGITISFRAKAIENK
jgi:hypothetical protein